MKPVILFGSTGNLGKKIAAELKQQDYEVTAVVRNEAKALEMKGLAHRVIIADVTKPKALRNSCMGFEIVVSALGKSVSPNDKSKQSFYDVDLNANSAILNEAVKSRVKKFVYVSALGAENYPRLDYFSVHHQFSERLIQSGIDYSIIKPPALFSAFVDLIDMAKKGRLVTFGKGEKLTNPIYEGDLAKVCVAAIHQHNAILEAGGVEVLSRRQINEMIQSIVAPDKKVRKVPMAVVKAALPFMKAVAPNLYDKMAFFTEVMQHDALAPRIGETKLADYVRGKIETTEMALV
jgi:uncharacterized protein YbjT (DUF2867 family)